MKTLLSKREAGHQNFFLTFKNRISLIFQKHEANHFDLGGGRRMYDGNELPDRSQINSQKRRC